METVSFNLFLAGQPTNDEAYWIMSFLILTVQPVDGFPYVNDTMNVHVIVDVFQSIFCFGSFYNYWIHLSIAS